jgi:hypothetical protein
MESAPASLSDFRNAVRAGEPGQLIVTLTQGKEMIVDDNPEARKLLAEHCWRFTTSSRYCLGRAECLGRNAEGGYTHLKFHRLLLGDVPVGKVVDHIDGNPLNNTRDNLRLVDQHVNTLNRGMSRTNTSGVTGVCRDDSCRHHRWIVQYAPSPYKSTSKCFTDAKFGGRDEAFKAAVAFRTSIEQTNPKYKEDLSHPGTRSSKRSRPTAPLKIITITTVTKKVVKKVFK